MAEIDKKARRGRRGADDLLAVELAKGLSVRDAAARVGVSEKTARRRVADPEFQAAVSRTRQTMVNTALRKLEATLAAAADKLAELLSAESEPVSLNAAKSVIELTTKLRAAEEIDAKIAALEEQLGGRSPSPRQEFAEASTRGLLERLQSLPPLGPQSRN